MARIAGVDLPRSKRIEVSLTYIFGIGPSRSRMILEALNIDPNTRCQDLTDDGVAQLRNFIDTHEKVEGDLRRETTANIKRLMDLGSYRGLRHRRGMPVRGQRTSTNARTRKGPRPTILGRKKNR